MHKQHNQKGIICLMWISSFRFYALVLCAASTTVVDGMHFGVQSDDGDIASSFASSMIYDAQKKRVYVTGSTFGGFFDPGGEKYKENSDCFLGVIQLPTRPGDSDPVWLRRMTIGNEALMEACSSIHAEVRDEAVRSLHLAGHSDSTEEGIAVSGMILDVSWINGMQGGYQIRSNQVQYPLFIQAHSQGNDLFVASMVSDSPDARVVSIDEQGVFQDNTVAGGSSIQNGDFFILVQRIQRNQGPKDNANVPGPQDISISQLWAQKMLSDSSMRLSGMTSLDGDRVLIASVESDPEDSNKYHPFLSVLNASTGEVTTTKKIGDSIQGASHHGLSFCRNEPSDSKSLYIVGSTNAPGAAAAAASTSSTSFRAFVMKISIETFEMEWISYLGAVSNEDTTGVNGLACSVTTDGSLMYFAGNVQAGSVVSLDGINPVISESLGGMDIFVAQIRENDGTLIYAHQIGSDQDDLLATGGGGLACDQEGNLIVLGNTRGSMFRHKEPIGEGLANDVVVFTVDRDTGTVGKIPGEVVPDRPNLSIETPDDQDLIFYPDESDPLFVDSTSKAEPGEEPASTPLRTGYIVGFVLVANLALFSSVSLFFFRREKHRGQHLYRKFLCSLVIQQDGYKDECSSIVSTSSSRGNEDQLRDFIGGENSATGSAYLVDDHYDFQHRASASSPRLHILGSVSEYDSYRSFREKDSGYDEDKSSSYYEENEDKSDTHGKLDDYEDAYEADHPPDLATRPHVD